MCCRYIELPFQIPDTLTADQGRWIGLHPGVGYSSGGRLLATAPFKRKGNVAHFDIPCTALEDDGTCALYGTPERPDMCSQWPDAPGQAPVGCLYNNALIGAT